MLTAFYPSVIIITVSTFVFLLLLFKKRISILKCIYLICFSVYISVLIGITLFPFPIQKELINMMIEDNFGSKNNFIPFYIFTDIFGNDFMDYGLSVFIRQIIGNILLFIPLGFILPILFINMKMKKVLIIGLVVSIVFEITQGTASYFVGYTYRSMDVDDLIFNFIGTLLGFLIFKNVYSILEDRNLLLVRNTEL